MTDLPPAARDTIGALAVASSTPMKVLITGGIGTGKTTVVTAARAALRARGATVLARAPRATDTSGAVVIDDGHLLTDDELAELTVLADDPETTLVVAAEPREHRAPLRALTAVIERESPRVALGPLPRAEIIRLAGTPDDRAVTALITATAGLPFLVRAALAPGVGASTDSIAQATMFALTERLRRLDEPVLSALLIASLSPGLGPADLAAALAEPVAAAQSEIDRAHATGLLAPTNGKQFLRVVHRAAATVVGTARHHDIETALLRSQVEMSTLTTDLALRLAEHGLRDDSLASVLETHATRAHDPRQAVRFYRAALDAGSTTVGAGLADALAMTGQCTAAAAAADDLLGSDDPALRAAAVRIAASVATHDGHAGQAAELFSWLGPYPDAVVGATGAIVLMAAGDLELARAAVRGPGAGPPTSAARTARNLAEGVLLTIEAPYASAVSRLSQAIAGEHGAWAGSEAIPDTPAALVTLAALHAGDAVRARSVINRAARGSDAGLAANRHTLLLGWVKMLDGQLTAAAGDAAAVGETGLHRRDALWAAALRTGIARRGGDAGALQKHWYAGMEVLAEYSVDLFSLLPIGELWVAAARMRQEDRLTHALDQAFALLTRLGDPPSWSVPLHWAGVHAAILTNSPEAMKPHGQALSAADNPFARALAVAGRSWLRVLAGQVDVDDVAAAARGLAQFGLTWDATRLAGQAALQTSDPRVASAMLSIARDLKLAGGAQDSPLDTAADADIGAPDDLAPASRNPAPASSGPLSDREREVAELLLLGMPYRDIGGQLFISAKTVEHHVARIRRRLGAESRSEMLSMLRAMLASQN